MIKYDNNDKNIKAGDFFYLSAELPDGRLYVDEYHMCRDNNGVLEISTIKNYIKNGFFDPITEISESFKRYNCEVYAEFISDDEGYLEDEIQKEIEHDRWLRDRDIIFGV